MIRHAAIDIVLNMSFLSRIGERFTNSHLVAPGDGVDECFMSTCEEACYKLFVFKGALNEGDIVESFKLLGDGLCLLTDMGSDLISSQVSVSPCLCVGRSTHD